MRLRTLFGAVAALLLGWSDSLLSPAGGCRDADLDARRPDSGAAR
jgi:hypothetical protein